MTNIIVEGLNLNCSILKTVMKARANYEIKINYIVAFGINLDNVLGMRY